MRFSDSDLATVVLFISVLAILFTATTRINAQLKDNFDDPNWQERWEIHDDGLENVPSAWFVGPLMTPIGNIPEGTLGNTTDTMGGPGPSGGDTLAGTYALTLEPGSESWSDYTVSVDMYHMDDDYGGLMLRYVDKLNYVRAWTKQQEDAVAGYNPVFGIDICVNGDWTFHFKLGGPGVGGAGIIGTPIPAGDRITKRQWFDMTVEAVGDTVTMYMQGEEMGSITDPELAPGGKLAMGKIALFNSTNPMAYDNVVVSAWAVSSAGKLGTTWGSLKAAYQR